MIQFMWQNLFHTSYHSLKSALSRARSFFSDKLNALFREPLNEEKLEELEQLLYEADFGVKASSELVQKMRDMHRSHPHMSPQEATEALRSAILALLPSEPYHLPELPSAERPMVILIVGVNGNGKTTSVAKLAHRLKKEGKQVLVAAADTFRAAAMEQLATWAQRADVDIVRGHPKSDPAAVTFDAIQAAHARHRDVVLVDTAGRLHTKVPLMQELEKIKRVCRKAVASAPHETFLVLDATTGQNGIDQARQFHQFTPLTGLILTKLDGTAKGGIVVAIQRELRLPIAFIGTGEGIEDLEPFDAQAFVAQLF